MLKLELVFEQRIGDADDIYSPVLEYQGFGNDIVLDKNIDEITFNTFIASWLNYCYDEQAIDKAFIDNIANGETALNGGLRLTMGDKIISPSCCCEFFDFKEWADICKGEKPNFWLGHDPTPQVSYTDSHIIIVSDSEMSIKPSQNIVEFKISYQEFNQAFDRIYGDVLVIQQFSEQWAKNHLPDELQ
ncbi:MAG: hypothetical protein Q4B79_08145 [Moraxella sp.]|uniref:hypothetical protein n=1 Tax=Moraxella sp. TaxID=479 RepID=UPI0026DDBCF0|nr:hypothetical protein [Moraxella sp.]MDO4450910.1 hypothetical protein [Moraxella sp.]